MATAGNYYVSVTGTIQQQGNSVLAEGLRATGWSGPYTYAQAKSVANNVSKRISAGAVSGATVGALSTEGGTAESGVSEAAGSAESAISSTTDFLQGLTSANLWIRVAKVVIGGVLVIVGVAKLTGAEKGIIGTAVKAAPLL